MSKPGPKPGSKKSSSHKRKIARSVTGKKNGRYKDGRRSYRRIAGAKNNDGTVVMHLDGNRNNNDPSNLKKSKGKKPGANSTSEHERSKRTIKERGAGRKKGSKNKLSHSVKVRSYKLFGTKR